MRSGFITILVLLVSIPALATSFTFEDAGRPHQLYLSEPINAATLEARAQLLPAAVEVKVANRLVIVADSRVELSLELIGSPALVSLERLHQYKSRRVYLASFTNLQSALGELATVQKLAGVLSVQPDILPLRERLNSATDMQSAIYYNEKTFNIAEHLPLAAVWPNTKGKGVDIAVIDVGVNLFHPSLQRVPLKHSWDIDIDVVGASPNPSQVHGNKVVGVIWAQPQLVQALADFTPGYAWGIAPEAGLIALRLQRPWTSNVFKAFVRAEQQGADVINVSWLLTWLAEPLREYLQYLTTDANNQKGIVIVASASPAFKPNKGLAAMPELVVVTSTDHHKNLPNVSWDAAVDFAAPSYLLTVSQLPGKTYEVFAKTSASAAFVSGWVALLRASSPELSARQIERLLKSSATARRHVLPDGSAFAYWVLDAEKSYAHRAKLAL